MAPNSRDRHERAVALGREVRATRKALRLDQETTARVAGVSVRFLRDLEHGKDTVQLRQVLAVCDALGIELRFAPRSLDVTGPGQAALHD